jgi:uncharacterized membrane protein (Fun14 family)
MREGYWRGLIGVALLSLSVLACRPVVTVGWSEIAILFVVVLFIAGPLLFRLYRILARFQKSEEREKRE